MKISLLTAVLALASPAAGLATDDVWSDGAFIAHGDTELTSTDDLASLQLKCALTFELDHKDHTFAKYFLDRAKFLKDGTVSYIRANQGTCTTDPSTKLETCKAKYFADGQAKDQPDSYNIYRGATADKISGQYFDSPDEFKQWQASGSPASDKLFWLQRCNGMDDATLAGHLDKAINTGNEADGQKALFMNGPPNAEDYDLARKVKAALKAK